ncbi:MAG: uncharacterized protein KVP18_001706 [Porospora cf. gigantea A]|uniref:uncharacterized protein n=1 Tax=Porospora cf. gigantea A TaxID=2853593 RepID=UPI00355A5E85|nr:MAG: hypothetical protein KVP18_001706 [Porospora cf. gigantea A]
MSTCYILRPQGIATFLVSRSLQRSVVRILLITPLYSVTSFSSLVVGLVTAEGALAIVVLRDVWEAVVIYCFMVYVLEVCDGEAACALEAQKDPGYVKHLPPLSWFIPESGCRVFGPAIASHGQGFCKWHYVTLVIPCSPQVIKYCKRGTLQFVVLKPVMAVIAVSGFLGRWGSHPVYTFIESTLYNISYSVALYALAIFYCVTKSNPKMKRYRPLHKFVSVKLVVFATYWQSLMVGLVKVIGNLIFSQYHPEEPFMTSEHAEFWKNFLLALEMPIFATLSYVAFPYSEYVPHTESPSRNLPRSNSDPGSWKFKSLMFKGKRLIGEAINAPRRLGAKVDAIADTEKRKEGLANFRQVIGMNDIAKDAIYVFDRRYADHTLVPSTGGETPPRPLIEDFTLEADPFWDSPPKEPRARASSFGGFESLPNPFIPPPPDL